MGRIVTIVQPSDPSLTGRLRPYLESGEELLWCGRPDPSVVFSPIDIRLLPFGVIFLGIAVRWTLGMVSVAGPVSALLGIPFLAAGLWIVVGRYIAAKLRKRNIVYALTNRRAVALLGSSSFLEAPVRGSSISFRRHRNGRHASVIIEPSASLYVGRPAPAPSPFSIRGVPTLGPATRRQKLAPGAIEFIDVRDADALLDAINILQVRAAATVNLLER